MNDKIMGTAILLISVIGIAVYAFLLFGTMWSLLVLEISAFVAVAGILGILAWIGWTMATTPSPEPIDTSDFDSSPSETKTDVESEEKPKTG